MSKIIHLDHLSYSLKVLHCELIKFAYNKHKEKAVLIKNAESKLIEKLGFDIALNEQSQSLSFLNVLELKVDLPAFIIKNKKEGIHIRLDCPKRSKEKKHMKPIIISLQSTFTEELSYMNKVELKQNDQYIGVQDNIYIRSFYEYLRKFLGVKDTYTKIEISHQHREEIMDLIL
jgi:hypothetical protein